MNLSFSTRSTGRIFPVLVGLAGAILVLGGTVAVLAEDSETGADAQKSTSERSYSLDRYASLWEKSLFFSAAPVAVADAAFARDYTLAGVFEMNGSTTAALVNKRDQSVVNVSDSSDGQAGGSMRLIAVELAGDPAQARVQVQKSGQRAWIAVAPSAAMAGTIANPAAAALIDRNAAPTSSVAPELPTTLENFPKPVAPQIAPSSVAAPPKPKVPGESVTPPPMPPSPLDAAMASEEKEIVVPIPDGE